MNCCWFGGVVAVMIVGVAVALLLLLLVLLLLILQWNTYKRGGELYFVTFGKVSCGIIKL